MSVQALAWVLDESEARGIDRLVLIILANHLTHRRESAGAFPGIECVAREARVSESTARRAIQRLEEQGEVIVLRSSGGRGKSNRYWLRPFAPETLSGRHPSGSAQTPYGDDTVSAEQTLSESGETLSAAPLNPRARDRGTVITGEPGSPSGSADGKRQPSGDHPPQRSGRLREWQTPPDEFEVAPMPDHLKRAGRG